MKTTTHGIGQYLFGERVRGVGAWFGRLYRSHNPGTGAPALLEVPTARTPHRVPPGPIRLLVTQWTGATPGRAVELQEGDPAHVVDALDSAAELAEQTMTAPGVVEHLSQRRPVSPPEPGILVDEETLEDLLDTANEVDAARAELAAVREAHARTGRIALAAHEEARVLRAEHARCTTRQRRVKHWGQAVAFAAAVVLSLWPRSIRDPKAVVGSTPIQVGLVMTNVLESSSSKGKAWSIPSEPIEGQKRPPCDTVMEREMNGGCWYSVNPNPGTVPPGQACPAGVFERNGQCWMPAGKPKRLPASIQE